MKVIISEILDLADMLLLTSSRGLQVNRKDKDQMSDTGGSSKGRLREPDFKPSREDRIKPERRKNKIPSDRDPDNDNDPDQGD